MSDRLTPQQFESEVLAAKPRTAVFDCDGTLWTGDAGIGFMNWTMDVGLLSRNSSDWIDSRHRLYRQGGVSELDICGEMVQVYAGLHEDELRRAAAEALEYQNPPPPGRGGERANNNARELCPPVSEDRSLTPDIERLAAAIRTGGFDL